MERYKNRLKQDSPEVPSSSRLMTDRNVYISFLEVQLERVTRSCADVQRFQDKVSHLDSQITLTAERAVKQA